ncbi:MAG TPA: DUF58 domain-containing protein [Candidatus Binataceae bacterium]|jgi:uncharacterized protein (DUF58 family)|nr:DUF58 domain-containing protein [Candidatus Binataceae bacterium]
MLEARAFEPGFLRRLDGLVLGVQRSRTVREGRRMLGRVQGLGIEPESFKEYTEGDDLRFLDWNAFARLDDLTIRTFRAEREIEVTILVDASASMGLPREDDKLGFALGLAASLAYVAMASNDAVRIGAFTAARGGAVRLETSALHRRRETYPAFRTFVSAVRAGGATQMSEAVGRLLLERRPAGTVILISDFLVSASQYEQALRGLLRARHVVKVIHVLGDRERSGDYPPGHYRVRDAETGELCEVTLGAAAAENCRRRVERLSSEVAEFCAANAISYAPAFGASHFDDIVMREFPRLGIVR